MIIKEAGRVSNDPRNGAMRHLFRAVRIGWLAFRELRQQEASSRDRAAQQQARLRAMTNEELQVWALQPGAAFCYPELRRRGLPVPGEVTSA